MSLLELQQLGGDGWGPIDLALAAGECVGVSGPSGIGKTRLLRAIADLDPHQGECVLDSQSCLTMTGADWRRQVGYLPAEPAWWGVSAAEHFTPSPDALAHLQVNASLLNQSIERLSSGERQRLALLRMLSLRPRVLLLDEPTANLDRDNTGRVEELIRNYLQQRSAAAIWVSHDEQQLQRCCNRELTMTLQGLTAT